MASNLTPEQIAALQKYYAQSSSGWSPADVQSYTSGGQTFERNTGEAGDGYKVYNSSKTAVGDPYSQYGQDGSFKSAGQFSKFNPNADFMQFLALAAAGGMGLNALGLTGAGGATATGLGGANGSWDILPEAMGGADSAALGGANGSWDMLPEAMGGDGYMLPDNLNGLNGSDVMSDSFAANGGKGAGGFGGGGGFGTGGATTAATTAAKTAGAGGLSGLLGPAAALAGGLLGSQKQEQGATTEKKLPDYLYDPVVKDLIPRAQGLLAAQMDPARMQGYAALRAAGQGLLSQPMAGNGFNQFYPR